MSSRILTLTQKQVTAFLKPRPRDSHKGMFGTVMVIGGAKKRSAFCHMNPIWRITLRCVNFTPSLLGSGLPDFVTSALQNKI